MQALAIRTLGIVLGLTLTVPALAEDWPQWRGVDRSGVWQEDGIVEQFPEGGLEAVWRVPIRGGYSGPVVADGRVFVTDWQRIEGTRAITGKERILALDEETGEELWSHEWDVNYSALQQSYAIGPRSTPASTATRCT